MSKQKKNGKPQRGPKKATSAAKRKRAKAREERATESRVSRWLAIESRPESVRLVRLFDMAERLGNEIHGFQCDHPANCRCRTCAYLNDTGCGPPNTRDYLTALYTVIRSATAIYEELPGSPRAEGVVFARPKETPEGKDRIKKDLEEIVADADSGDVMPG